MTNTNLLDKCVFRKYDKQDDKKSEKKWDIGFGRQRQRQTLAREMMMTRNQRK